MTHSASIVGLTPLLDDMAALTIKRPSFKFLAGMLQNAVLVLVRVSSGP